MPFWINLDLHVSYGEVFCPWRWRPVPPSSPFHTFSQKKKTRRIKNNAVQNSTICLLPPLDARGRGRNRLSPLLFLLSIFFLNFKKMSTQHPHLLVTWWKNEGDIPLGWLHSGRFCFSLPCFSYKYRGRKQKKRERERRGRQNRRRKELKTEKKKKRKTEEEKKRKT